MTAPVQRIVVGTAGHIDHGKTSLVAALTGIDCDRWAEEKERGITIDLGFAYLNAALESGESLQIGFVDVPGHERFVHNALAGLGGIRLMMMVVAADEGIKPQTEEHLAICSLLQIPAGIVVLTKSDLVDDETLELAQLELTEALEGGPFDGAPMIPVSSKTGAGIDTLRDALVALAADLSEDNSARHREARLPVDRAFHLRGLGVLITGTQQAGTLSAGDTLSLFPQGGNTRIRSLQVHGEPREMSLAGERVSAQLTGVELDEVSRGTVLAPTESLPTSRVLLVRYRHLSNASTELLQSTEVRFHLHTSEALARIRPLSQPTLAPGEEGICALYLRRPVSAVRGDRFILRRPSPASTLGGGEILDPEWRKPRGRELAPHIERLAADTPAAIREWIAVAREAGITSKTLSRRLTLTERELDPIIDELVKNAVVLEAGTDPQSGRRLLAPKKVLEVGERAKERLRAHFKANRLAHGLPKAELISSILPAAARDLGPTYLDWLSAGKVLVIRGDQVNLPGRATGITDEESALATQMTELYIKEGLTPRSPPELQRSLGAPPKVFEGLLKYLTQQRAIVRLPSGLFLSQSALDQLKTDVLAQPWTEITVAAFKDHFALSRKWAIPLLEYLDAQHVTRRRGDIRLVLR